MTPLSAIFQLPITSKLDYETLGRVLKAGHSRIPVYEEVAKDGKGGKTKKKVVGVLLTKQLILLDPEGLPCSLRRIAELSLIRSPQTQPRSPKSQ